MKQYDYIIAGAGASGLSLAFYLAKSTLKNKKVLLIDKDDKKQNDRTWSFWQIGESPFEEIVQQKWQNIHFISEKFHQKINIAPYHYKTIRGEDFYRFTKSFISQNTDFEFLQATIKEIDTKKELVVRTDKGDFEAGHVFDGRWQQSEQVIRKSGYYYMYQHFKGWVIETPTPTFEADTVHYMDFRVPQKVQEARFGYVLPFSSTKALVEFTVFSETLLAPEEYVAQLQNYLHTILCIRDYHILEEEFGIIPMFDAPLEVSPHSKVTYIGTKAGNAKASTGFAFDRIQRYTKKIVENLEKNNFPLHPKPQQRYSFYDSTLLNVIASGKMPADEVFATMFAKHSHSRIFRFLGEESNFSEDLKIMYQMPWLPFLKAVGQNFFSRILS